MTQKFITIALLLALALGACATYERTGAPEPEEAAALPPADGAAIRHYLTRENDYRRWDLWPGKGRFYPGTQPHGALLTTYVSSDVLRALETGAGRVPDGGMIVKENYTAGRKLSAVTVMYRRPGFNPDAGNWYWLKFDASGEVLEEGRVAACIECHGQARDNDWLFTGPTR